MLSCGCSAQPIRLLLAGERFERSSRGASKRNQLLGHSFLAWSFFNISVLPLERRLDSRRAHSQFVVPTLV